MKISVVTPSVRPEGLKLVEKALQRQTERDYEWIIVSPFKPSVACNLWVPSAKKEEGDYWTVYKDYNLALAKAQGELVVSWQDYTFADPDCLEKFWFHHTKEPKTIVSAVGGKYSEESFTIKTWDDPRETTNYGTYYPCFFNDIELNLAAFPKEAFYAVGGFDEYLDKYSSLCGLDVLDRLNLIGGYDFKLDQTIKSYSLEHGRLPDWEKNTPFKGAYTDRRKLYVVNPALDYLK